MVLGECNNTRLGENFGSGHVLVAFLQNATIEYSIRVCPCMCVCVFPCFCTITQKEIDLGT